jgi:hypothetical protein
MNTIHTRFYENQSCDSESKMGTHAQTHAHTYTHGMVILVILFVFILRKEIWPQKGMSKSFTEHVSVSTFNIPTFWDVEC